ncbi:hypothetical protein DYU11_28650 [Fibrisoma montanum]|uniref:CSD domain-containing protein n=1 Tax=Fibrisoma montanum TaxID=2305895 RepID=A0A418LYV8_9BACT|nr:hypothetical protein DYU11_28650 [Fibrisoma montanum]
MAIAKWGFGMAPISKVMGARYESAVTHVLNIIDDVVSFEEVNIDYISELKGMFNRGLKQDQWDWFTVHCKLGSPANGNTIKLVNNLIEFRQSIKDKNWERASEIKASLIGHRIKLYLLNYLGCNSGLQTEVDGGFIYILSTKELPNILKIGMTTRNVQQRVKEINSATGVLHPYSARKIFKVKNARIAESVAFNSLKEFRIREDREFFNLEFSKAVNILVNTFLFNNLISRQKGIIKWFNIEKGFGFITCDNGSDVYFNKEAIIYGDQLSAGELVEFDIRDSVKGPKAANIYVTST